MKTKAAKSNKTKKIEPNIWVQYYMGLLPESKKERAEAEVKYDFQHRNEKINMMHRNSTLMKMMKEPYQAFKQKQKLKMRKSK